MGQVLERFSSVTEEKKNKEIERIAEGVYEKYLKELETEKSQGNQEPSNKPKGNQEPANKPKGNQEPSNKANGNPETPNKPDGNPETSNKPKGNQEPSNKAKGNLETPNKPGENPETSNKPEESPETSKKSNEAKTSKYKAKFYRAVCEIVGELNKTFGTTQFKVPSEDNLKKAFEKYRDPDKPDGPTKPVTKEQFQRMLQEILKTESVFAGFGAADALIYMFTVPPAAVLAKQRFFPRAIRNEVLIPGVTSATVYALAKLNKI